MKFKDWTLEQLKEYYNKRVNKARFKEFSEWIFHIKKLGEY